MDIMRGRTIPFPPSARSPFGGGLSVLLLSLLLLLLMGIPASCYGQNNVPEERDALDDAARDLRTQSTKPAPVRDMGFSGSGLLLPYVYNQPSQLHKQASLCTRS